MRVRSNGPQLGSCDLQTQATGDTATRFLNSRTLGGAGRRCASRKGSAASGEVPGAPAQGCPLLPRSPAPPSPTHGAEGGTQRSMVVPSSPARVLLLLKRRLNFKHMKCPLISRGLFAGSAACAGCSAGAGQRGSASHPGTKGSNNPANGAVTKLASGPHPSGSAQGPSLRFETELVKTKTVWSVQTILYLNTSAFFQTLSPILLKMFSTTLY